MNNKQLEYIVAIAEEGNLSKAAERLFITQSALSQQLAKLKAEGLPPLFVQNKHRMELTDAGKIYLNGARSILMFDAQAIEAICNLKKETIDEFHLSVAPYLQRFFYTQIFPRLKEEFPDTKIYVTATDITNTRSLLSGGQIDLAFIPDIYKQVDFFEYKKIMKDQLVIISARNIETHDLPYVVPTETTYIRELIQRIFSYYGRIPEIYAETNDIQTITEMVNSGSCRAILPRKLVSRRTSVFYIESFPEPYYFDLVCIYKKDNKTELISRTVSLIRELF